jgi:hypothetical protein
VRFLKDSRHAQKIPAKTLSVLYKSAGEISTVQEKYGLYNADSPNSRATIEDKPQIIKDIRLFRAVL